MQLKNIFAFIFLFTTFIFSHFSAQNISKSNLSNEEIEKRIDENSGNPAQMWELINFYISKSKKEQNSEALFYAYRYASMASNYPQNIKYADSALSVGKSSGNKKLLTEAHLNRSVVYMNESLYQKALEMKKSLNAQTAIKILTILPLKTKGILELQQ